MNATLVRYIIPAYLIRAAGRSVYGVQLGPVPTLAHLPLDTISGVAELGSHDLTLIQQENGEGHNIMVENTASNSDFLAHLWTLKTMMNEPLSTQNDEYAHWMPELRAYDPVERLVTFRGTINEITASLPESESNSCKASPIALQFGPRFGKTWMYGGAKQRELEHSFEVALRLVKAFVATDESLWMFDGVGEGAGCVLEWRRAKTYPFVGSRWTVLAMNDGSGGSRGTQGVESQIVFEIAEDGTLSGRHGHAVVVEGKLNIVGAEVAVEYVDAVGDSDAEELALLISAWKSAKALDPKRFGVMIYTEQGNLAVSLVLDQYARLVGTRWIVCIVGDDFHVTKGVESEVVFEIAEDGSLTGRHGDAVVVKGKLNILGAELTIEHIEAVGNGDKEELALLISAWKSAKTLQPMGFGGGVGILREKGRFALGLVPDQDVDLCSKSD